VEDRIAMLWREAYEKGATIPLLQEVLQLDPDQAQVQRSGCTLLHMAAGHRLHDAVALLLMHGAQVNAVDDCGETALHKTAWNLDPEGCQQLLEAGADPTVRDRLGRTPLDGAVKGDIGASREDRGATQRLLGQAWVKASLTT
jgi:ankyrin repeat protein